MDDEAVDRQIDEVIETFDRWCWEDNMEALSKALDEANVDELDPAVSLSMLSMTFCVKDRLSFSRQNFYNRVKEKLISLYCPADADTNLQGLC